MHGHDTKFVPLTHEDLTPSTHTLQYLDFLLAWTRADLSALKVLDLGCGRGEFVGALRERGARAFGVEIDRRFLASGRLLGELYCDEFPILSPVDKSGLTVFPDGYFDLVVSDQVLEHVRDLESLAAEVGRLLRPGGLTANLFPARFRVWEPHYELPFTHWLPKGAARRTAVATLLSIGMGSKFFPNHSLSERVEIIYKYSVEETFYRSCQDIAAAFESRGISVSLREGMKAYIESRLGRSVPRWTGLGPLISTFRVVMFTGRKS